MDYIYKAALVSTHNYSSIWLPTSNTSSEILLQTYPTYQFDILSVSALLLKLIEFTLKCFCVELKSVNMLC